MNDIDIKWGMNRTGNGVCTICLATADMWCDRVSHRKVAALQEQKHPIEIINIQDWSMDNPTPMLPVGIKWLPEDWRLSPQLKQRIRAVFAGYVRITLPLSQYPTVLGDHFTIRPGKNDLVKELWWNNFHVAILIQNPNDRELPSEGVLPPPTGQKLLAAPTKPASEKQAEIPSFGWDPGYGDD